MQDQKTLNFAWKNWDSLTKRLRLSKSVRVDSLIFGDSFDNVHLELIREVGAS